MQITHGTRVVINGLSLKISKQRIDLSKHHTHVKTLFEN